MPDLRVSFLGLNSPNPFWVGSGPPTTNANVVIESFKAGWGGAVLKTIGLRADLIHNVGPRYHRVYGPAGKGGPVILHENIELISDLPLAQWLIEVKRIKDAFPSERPVIASVMAGCNSPQEWADLMGPLEEAGVDGFEANLSCPHGFGNKGMGAAIGSHPELIARVAQWMTKATKLPVFLKLTPNDVPIDTAATPALEAGAHIAAINTVGSLFINMDTLKPSPTVEGMSCFGGLSGTSVLPIALKKCAQVGKLIADKYPNAILSGIGGIGSGVDAAAHILVGASCVQVCTMWMSPPPWGGVNSVTRLIDELSDWMTKHQFETIDAFRGTVLPSIVEHDDLVRARHGANAGVLPVSSDSEWRPDHFVAQTDSLVSQ